jgi:CopG family nickel-responsive transcriptional regulator
LTDDFSYAIFLKKVAQRSVVSRLVRFGVSLEQELLDKFDRLAKEKNYTNRSEAFRDLMRQELVQKQWHEGKEVAGAITLIYDHHRRELVNKLMDIQHDFGGLIISSQHVHLDHSNCLEIIAFKGSPKEAQKLADSLKSVKGVKHGTLSMTTTGKDM